MVNLSRMSIDKIHPIFEFRQRRSISLSADDNFENVHNSNLINSLHQKKFLWNSIVEINFNIL